jgi:hypothetical protein
MDPYLDDHWDDVHARLVIYLSEALQRSRPNDLRARIEERVFVASDDRELRSIYPDVRIDERTRAPGHVERAAGAVNSVEIDLLRCGQHATAAPADRLPQFYRAPYRICWSRATRPEHWEVDRVPLPERQPASAIPLRPLDAEAAAWADRLLRAKGLRK